MILTDAKIVLVEYKYGGSAVSTHRTARDLVAHLLASNGAEFLQVVEEQLLPNAKRVWAEEAEAELEAELEDE